MTKEPLTSKAYIKKKKFLVAKILFFYAHLVLRMDFEDLSNSVILHFTIVRRLNGCTV